MSMSKSIPRTARRATALLGLVIGLAIAPQSRAQHLLDDFVRVMQGARNLNRAARLASLTRRAGVDFERPDISVARDLYRRFSDSEHDGPRAVARVEFSRIAPLDSWKSTQKVHQEALEAFYEQLGLDNRSQWSQFLRSKARGSESDQAYSATAPLRFRPSEPIATTTNAFIVRIRPAALGSSLSVLRWNPPSGATPATEPGGAFGLGLAKPLVLHRH